MNKIIAGPVKLFLSLVISSTCYSQTEMFDIITYSPPKDWKKTAKQDVVNYIDVNETTGGFCVVAMYASTASTGDAQKDFRNKWKELVSTPYKANPNPKTETQTTPDGWKVIIGAVSIKQDGTDVYIILTVFSGFGKTVSVRSSMNDQSYTTQIDVLFETMELDQSTTSSIKNNNTVKAPAKGGEGKFGLMEYTKPAGWNEQAFQDGVVFKPIDLPAGEHLAVQIMQPLNFTGSLEQALKQSFDEAAIMYKGNKMYQSDGNYGKIAPYKSYNGWEYIRGKGGLNVNGTELGLELFVVKINNRFERVAILESRTYCGGVSRYYTTDRISYRNGIEELLFSLQFTDFNETPLESGSANGSGITGIWQGTMQSTSASVLRLEAYSAIFLTNGQVYFGTHFPTEGLEGLNTRIPPELNRRDWKTYTYSNGKGVLKMIYADIPFRIEGNKLVFTKNQTDWTFFKLNPVDGARFSGTYIMSESYGKIPTITFTADGRFTDNGAIGVLYHFSNNCVNPGSKPGSGTYEVKNYSILFEYSDGRKVKLAFPGIGYNKNNQSPATLRMSYNEDPMTRQ